MLESGKRQHTKLAFWSSAMTEKRSPVHPALRADFVTVPWKRRRRINLNAWARVAAETERIPVVPSTAVRPPPRSKSGYSLIGVPSRNGLTSSGEIILEQSEENRRLLAKPGP